MTQSRATDVFVLPSDRPWTIDDLERLPDDGNRYEIANGSLLVSPPPSVDHGVTALRLAKVLASQAPDGIEVVPTGIGVQVGDSVYVPDLLVTPVDALALGGRLLAARHALLVVEVLSPSNRKNDLVLKLTDYADAGIPAYWIVDPVGPKVTVLELDDHGKYDQREVVRPGLEWQTERPFPLTINPAAFR